MNLCRCGCGLVVAAQFRSGHNGRLTRRLLRAALAGRDTVIYGRSVAPLVYAEWVSPGFAGELRRLLADAAHRGGGGPLDDGEEAA